MKDICVPPSPNWYLSQIIDCSESGKLAYGSRETVVLYDEENHSFSYIPYAHKGKITSVQFAPAAAGNKLVSCGEDCVVCVWDLDTLQGTVAHIVHTSSQHSPVASWSRADPNLIVSADYGGYIASWNLQTNLTRTFHFKLSFTTVACSPHHNSIVALGTRAGLLYVMDVTGRGHVIHKLRGHDVDIVSLAWCPIRGNIFNPNEEDTCLLASGARDTTIYLWRIGSDGRYEKAIHLPASPFADTGYRAQLPSGPGQHGSWTAVCWAEPRTLVAATQWGELVAFDLLAPPSDAAAPATPVAPAGRAAGRKTNNWRLLHGKHNRGLFSIACRPYSGDRGDERAEKAVWTASQDRLIISCTLTSGNVLRTMPTMGAPVYTMDISPIDGSRLAVGVGDKSIRIWNLSDPNPDSMITLWNKIAGKVYSLAWHPKQEGCLAYGTSDGRIGLYDTMSNKPPILFRLHFTQAVYLLEWGPNINLRGAIGSGEEAEAAEGQPKEVATAPPPKKSEYLLYAIADNQACAFDPAKPSGQPVNLKYILRGSDAVGKIKLGRKRTGLSWKPDFSLLAVGNEDGSVHLLTPHEPTGLRHVRTVSVHSKLVQDLAWHPPSSSDEYLPSYSNWLAVASNASEVRVVDVSNLLANVADMRVDAEGVPVPVVAVLKGHSQRIVSVEWNPHVGGQLLSASYDESAVIWDVASQQPLRHFSAHCGVVLCGLWHPLDADLVLTGAGDATLRVWQASAQSEGPPPAKKKVKPALGAQQALPDKSFDTSDSRTDKSPRLQGGTSVEVAKSEESLRHEKKKIKEKSLFPVSGPLMNEPMHLLKNLQRVIDEKGTAKVSVGEAPLEASAKSEPKEDDLGGSAFFGDSEAVAQLLARERSALLSMEHFEGAFTLDIWRSKIKDAVEEATKNHRLTDYIVSLSPMASIKLWQSTCLAYAEQLCRSGEFVRSAGYYLAVHKVEEAVNMLMEKGLSRQAIVIAKSRLASGDPFVKGLMEKWAEQKVQEGQHEVAANCLASIGEWTEAADVLARRRCVPHLCVAAQLASRGGAHEKAATIFLDCLKLNRDEHWDLVTSCLANLRQQEHLKVLVAVHKLLSKRFQENLEPERWLKGTFENQDNSFDFDFVGKVSGTDGDVVVSKQLDLPLQKLLSSGLSLSSREEALLTVSLHLALAIVSAPKCFTDLPGGLSFLEEDRSDVHEAVRRLVQAMAALSSYQLRDPNNGHHLLKLCILLSPKGPTHPCSIFSEELSISPAQKSLRAYLCTGILNWLMENGSSFIPPKPEVYADRKPALRARRRCGRDRDDATKTDQEVPGSGKQVVSAVEGGETADATIQPTESVHHSTEQDATAEGGAQPTVQTAVESRGEKEARARETAADVADPPVDPSNGTPDQPAVSTEAVDVADPPVDPSNGTADQLTVFTEAADAVDLPVDPSNGTADQPAVSTETDQSASQPENYTANHTAECTIETAAFESVDNRMPVDYPKPAWVQALDLVKRYGPDLFAYSNMRYFSDSVRIKVLLHMETSATKEKLSSSVKKTTEDKEENVGARKGDDRGEGPAMEAAEEVKKEEEITKESGEETTKEDGGETMKRDGKETTKEDGGETTKEDGGETTEEDGEETTKEDGEETTKEDGGDIKKEGGDMKKKDGEIEEENVETEKEDGEIEKEISEPPLTERQREIKQLQEWFSSFEKDQVVVPNPFVCYTNLTLLLNETLTQVDKEQAETYAEYFKNVWEEAKAIHANPL